MAAVCDGQDIHGSHQSCDSQSLCHIACFVIYLISHWLNQYLLRAEICFLALFLVVEVVVKNVFDSDIHFILFI